MEWEGGEITLIAKEQASQGRECRTEGGIVVDVESSRVYGELD